MKLRRGLAVLAVAGLVGAGYVAYAASADAGPAYRTAVASVGDVEQTMALSGSLQPASTADLQLGTSGKVATVAVEEGEQVRAGQLVLQLDRTALRAAVRRANAQLTAAQARLESDRNAQTAAAAESTPTAQPTATPTQTPTQTPTPEPEPEPDPALAEQQQAVIEAQSAASAALAEARTALDAEVAACADPAAEGCAAALTTVQTAQEAVATAQDTLQAALDALTKTLAAAAQPQPSEQTEEPVEQQPVQQQPVQQQPVQESTPTVTITAADLARDQADIDQARADLVAAQQALRAATVRAPHAGRIAGLAVAVGDRATAGDVVASLISRGTTTVELDVTGTQVRQLETGQRASVTPAGTVKPLAGRVSEIGVLPDTASGSTTYSVTVTLNRRDLSLPTGVTAAVDVVIGTATDVVTVPASAVRDGAVTILDDGETTLRPVTTGLVGATRIEVEDGLKTGDLVVVADLDAALPSSEGGETGDDPTEEFQMRPGGPAGPGGGPVVIHQE